MTSHQTRDNKHELFNSSSLPTPQNSQNSQMFYSLLHSPPLPSIPSIFSPLTPHSPPSHPHSSSPTVPHENFLNTIPSPTNKLSILSPCILWNCTALIGTFALTPSSSPPLLSILPDCREKSLTVPSSCAEAATPNSVLISNPVWKCAAFLYPGNVSSGLYLFLEEDKGEEEEEEEDAGDLRKRKSYSAMLFCNPAVSTW
ncbi:hypothetical protein PT974_00217 [Cladobotryum mycophilum]|uniref:Uncharacterized protein n=1 Tax=Cladobotryum mycophilum TaxID=491253 RepID=A0ABR0T0A7_9HYPO